MDIIIHSSDEQLVHKDDFKKFWKEFNKADDDLEWITVRGAHIPIKPGQSKTEAVNEKINGGKSGEKKPTNGGESKKPENSNTSGEYEGLSNSSLKQKIEELHQAAYSNGKFDREKSEEEDRAKEELDKREVAKMSPEKLAKKLISDGSYGFEYYKKNKNGWVYGDMGRRAPLFDRAEKEGWITESKSGKGFEVTNNAPKEVREKFSGFQQKMGAKSWIDSWVHSEEGRNFRVDQKDPTPEIIQYFDKPEYKPSGPIKVYRGITGKQSGDSEHYVSWSRDRSVAESFAGDEDGKVIERIVTPEEVFIEINKLPRNIRPQLDEGGSEREVILKPTKK